MVEEGLRDTDNTMISVARPMEIDDAELMRGIERLQLVAGGESRDIRTVLREVVPTYHPKEEQ